MIQKIQYKYMIQKIQLGEEKILIRDTVGWEVW
jgi:hypothetical protein